MPHDPRALLADVLEAARSIERFRLGIDLDGFRGDELIRSGVERKLGIVGEALNRLTREDPELAARIPDIADPPIAIVGMTEAEVKAKRFPAVSATTPLRYVPRAGAVRKPVGAIKLIASTLDERVLGVHMIGESAPEVIHEAAMALRYRAALPDRVDLLHVYPTMSESLKIGA